jgi:hypothetical protein
MRSLVQKIEYSKELRHLRLVEVMKSKNGRRMIRVHKSKSGAILLRHYRDGKHLNSHDKVFPAHSGRHSPEAHTAINEHIYNWIRNHPYRIPSSVTYYKVNPKLHTHIHAHGEDVYHHESYEVEKLGSLQEAASLAIDKYINRR